ncbi:hypothetical protein [Spirosoma spitsbergense]|uniref:hypothetical protein n=1 Tax=Spirosoma spitsbergense TaxID=431554 RepID=UPI00035C1242|nr:hypothetical protein [Spirosoma spitsbergense]
MAKTVTVLNSATGIKFGFGERTVVVSDKMAVADAESIQALYPGVYCKVTDQPAATTPAATTEKANK